MTEVLVWGTGSDFREYVENIHKMATIYNLHIRLTSKNRPNYIDGDWPFIPVTEINPDYIEYVIITSTAHEESILADALQLGFNLERIFPLSLLLYKQWDWFGAISYISNKAKHMVMHREKNLSDMEVEKSEVDLSETTILSMNCCGGYLYHSQGARFLSPLINMYAHEGDFLRFLAYPKKYVEAPLKFAYWKSKIADGKAFPVFTLLDIRIFMNHYDDIDSAICKWEERKKRINWDNLFVVMSTNWYWIAKEFDWLPYKRKACIVPFDTDLVSCIPVDRNFTKERLLNLTLNAIARGEYPKYTNELHRKMLL